jgi:hypothetical protein
MCLHYVYRDKGCRLPDKLEEKNTEKEIFMPEGTEAEPQRLLGQTH